MKAIIFPGQGAQFSGMGKALYHSSPTAKSMFKKANKILDFDICNTMFEGTDEELKKTEITQPAIFLHSVILFKTLTSIHLPDCVAGHSLGEFSALVANGCLSFEDGLFLVQQRAKGMQEACDEEPSSMAAILGLSDEIIEEVCKKISGIICPANYNCEGQVVISGQSNSIQEACEKLKEKGAKRAIPLAVNGAFHSILMKSAQEKLKSAIEKVHFNKPHCPIYHNVTATPNQDPKTIKSYLIEQLTSPVRWKQTMQNMIKDGVNEAIEIGPGNVLQTLFKKTNRTINISGFS